MNVDHVTYQIPEGEINHPDIAPFFALLGMEEWDPSEDILEQGWTVRWFGFRSEEFTIHLVEADAPEIGLGLGHFCLKGVGPVVFARCRRSGFCERDSGINNRIWLAGPHGLRAEVHP